MYKINMKLLVHSGTDQKLKRLKTNLKSTLDHVLMLILTKKSKFSQIYNQQLGAEEMQCHLQMTKAQVNKFKLLRLYNKQKFKLTI